MDFGVQAPKKNGYKFNEITSLTGVKPYVLRFWESEFPQINPELNETGQKVYNGKDLLAVKAIKKLLFEDKLAIPEAKNLLDKEVEAMNSKSSQPDGLSANAFDEESTEESIETKSKELKKALESIIEHPPTTNDNLVYKSSSLASRFKKEVRVHERSLSEQEVVNLVSAKKKLTKLLGVIENLERKRGWGL